jgi:hypothetical protein
VTWNPYTKRKGPSKTFDPFEAEAWAARVALDIYRAWQHCATDSHEPVRAGPFASSFDLKK